VEIFKLKVDRPKESVTSIANAGNLYSAVLRFVLAVQMDNNARQPLDDVSVGCRTTVQRPRPDAANYLHDFLFRLFVIPADENIAQWRINFASIDCGNIVQGADH